MLVLLGCFGLLMPGLRAASLVFPRVTFDQSGTTGLAIANLDSAEAKITLTAYGTDGQLLTGPGFVNPVELTIPANEQIARPVTTLFNTALPVRTTGWIHLTGGSDAVAGFFLYLNSTVTRFDGADLPISARKIVYNLVRNDSDYSTEINLVNPSAAVAPVTLDLVRPDGSKLSQQVSLPAHGISRFSPSDLFSVSTIDAGSYLVATSSGSSIAGFEFVTSSNGDLLGLNACDADDQKDYLYFPQMVALSPWESELGLVNYSTDPVIVTIYARKADGSLYDADSLTTNPVTRGLEAGESLSDNVAELFGFKPLTTVDGWIEVRASAPSLNGYLRYGIPSVGSLTAIAGATTPSRVSVFSHIATSSGFFHGLALLNSATLTANTRILAMTPEGEILGSLDTVLRPKQRISKLLTELIPETANRNDGFIWIRSDQPLHTISIFGTSKTLANVPPQKAPETYKPDEELPQVKISPPLAVVQPGKSQKFVVTGTTGTVDWQVNGVSGGVGETGQVTTAGVYTAPTAPPKPALVTVTAEAGDLRGGASIDIIEAKQLLSGLGELQSIVYLQSAQQLYEVELVSFAGASSGPAPAQSPAASNRSDLYQVVPPATRVSVKQFSDNIVKMISYPASNGREYILMIGQDSGSLLRFDTQTQQTRVVFNGLNQPTSLVYDPIAGVVLVAEADRIREIGKSFLEAGLSSATGRDPVPGRPGVDESTLIPDTGATGIAVDLCTGEIYYSQAETGLIKAYNRTTGETRVIVSGLLGPGQLLIVYREGLPCPDRTQLLVAEPGAGRIGLVAPALGVVVAWTPAEGVRDLTFLPPDNPFNLKTSIAYGLFFDLLGEINFVDVEDQYGPDPVIVETGVCSGSIPFDDANLEAKVRQVLGLGEDDPITCELASTITELDASGLEIASLGGIEYLVNLQILDVSDNLIEDLAPIGGLAKLESVDASYNLIRRPGLVPNLDLLTSLNLSHNQIDDLTLLGGLEFSGAARSNPGTRPRSLVLASLTTLDLSFNHIANLSPLANLSRLRLLNLSDNGVIEDISPLATLIHLEELLLANSKIQAIDALRLLTSLRILNIAGNRIVDISPLLANAGLALGDIVELLGNPVSPSSCTVVELLRQRGVTIDVELNCAVDLAVEIRSEVSQANLGDLLLFHGWVNNLGTDVAENVQAEFVLSPFLTPKSFSAAGASCSRSGQTVSCVWTTLVPGTRVQIQIRGLVNQSYGTITNQLSAAAAQSELNLENNSTSNSIPIANADLVISKTASSEFVGVEDNLTYTITVVNNGPQRATGIRIRDPLPASFYVDGSPEISSGSCTVSEGSESSLVECSVGVLESGQSVVLTIPVFVGYFGETATNTATVTAREVDPRPLNNSASVTVSRARVDLTVTGEAAPSTAILGVNLIYSLQVENLGNSPATDATLYVSLDPGVSLVSLSNPACTNVEGSVNCALGDLAGGAKSPLILTVLVESIGQAGQIGLNASVSTSAYDEDYYNDFLSLWIPAIARADLSAGLTSPQTVVRPGDSPAFNLQVNNSGPSPASNVTATLTYPGSAWAFIGSNPSICTATQFGEVSCAVGSLASGANTAIALLFDYQEPISVASFLTTASVAGQEPDPNLANNVSNVTLTNAAADLGVTVVDDPDPSFYLEPITYTIEVSNSGPETATNAYMSMFFDSIYVDVDLAVPDQGSCQIYTAGLPYVYCDLGTLNSGGTIQIRVEATPTSEFYTLGADVSVGSNELDPNSSNDSASASTFIDSGPPA